MILARYQHSFGDGMASLFPAGLDNTVLRVAGTWLTLGRPRIAELGILHDIRVSMAMFAANRHFRGLT